MMRREFSPREKAMLLLLAIMVLILVYYLGTYRINKEAFDERNRRIAELQDEIVMESVKLSKMKAVEEKLELIKSGEAETVARIPDFDNIQSLMRTLNMIAATTNKYDMNFAELGFAEGFIRRPVSMSFEVRDYRTAVSVMESLAGCEYRSLIKKIDVSPKESGGSLNSGAQMLRLEALFFELNI